MGKLLYIKDYIDKQNRKSEYTYKIEQYVKELLSNQVRLKKLQCSRLVIFRKYRENSIKKEIITNKQYIVAYNKLLYDACDNLDDALKIAAKEVALANVI